MPAPPDRPKRSLFRRAERAVMGLIMAVMAFFIEKLVMRSIRKGGGDAKPDAGTPMQSKGTSIEG
jgi:hypothetical protein